MAVSKPRVREEMLKKNVKTRTLTPSKGASKAPSKATSKAKTVVKSKAVSVKPSASAKSTKKPSSGVKGITITDNGKWRVIHDEQDLGTFKTTKEAREALAARKRDEKAPTAPPRISRGKVGILGISIGKHKTKKFQVEYRRDGQRY